MPLLFYQLLPGVLFFFPSEAEIVSGEAEAAIEILARISIAASLRKRKPSRLRVTSLSLSPSCVTRRETTEKKMAA